MELSKLYDKIPYDRMYNFGWGQRMAMLASLSVIVLVLFYFALVTGQNTEIERLEGNLAKIEKDIRDNKAHAAKLDKLKDRIRKLDAELAVASQQLPTSKEIPNLLTQISNLGTQFGLEFITFQPKQERMKEHYAEVPVQLKVIGQFHNILMFFDEISHLKRIVTIQKINMKQNPNKRAGEIEMGCEALTYRYIEPSKRKKVEVDKKGKKGKKRKKRK